MNPAFHHPPNTHASSSRNIVIDPMLTTPLPNDDDDDNDFPPPHKLLPKIANPASKIAGVHHSDKGKGRAGKRRATGSSGPLDAKKQKGRASGAPNYTLEDVEGLLDILSVNLPLGGRAWNTAADDFYVWAEENGRPARTAKSLEAKFKQVSHTLNQDYIHTNSD
jgi:hypothetical protein